MCQVHRFPSAGDFLQRCEAFLVAAEVENNLILGVARALTERGRDEGMARPFFAAVLDRDRVVMCAFLSLPGRLGITRAQHASAIEVLAADVWANGPDVRFISGIEPTAGKFAAVFANAGGLHVHSDRAHRSQRIHRLDRVIPVESRASGSSRSVEECDNELILGWLQRFFVELGERDTTPAIALERLRDVRMFLWQDAGRVVSMAGAVQTTLKGARVVFVYTPPDLRGRGYASACVETLSQQLLDEGNHYCCLYTDLANPTSNRIYARLGYVPVCDAGAYWLEADETAAGDRPRATGSGSP